ncbi:MAG: hypothetical protein RL708_408 [Bacteroidota bacterium]|jgi:hypothetical protein
MNKEIENINSAIEAYFVNHPNATIVPAKELMPAFIAAGIFKKDFKNGKPIRDVLRALNRNNQLSLIPYVHIEQKDENIYWYFIPANAPKPTTLYKQEHISAEKLAAEKSRLLSDESYVIDLCDTALQQKSERQKRFHFLLGDLHKDGVSQTRLPVDAYYKHLKLVIEYKEPQQTILNDTIEKEEVKTVSGVNRGEQRKIYDERRRVQLPLNGIKLIEISYDAFTCDSDNKIVRNAEQDLQTIETILKNEKAAENKILNDENE